MSNVSKFLGLGANPGYDPDGEAKYRKALRDSLRFSTHALLDNQRDMHFGIGLPKGLQRWSIE